MLNDSSESLSSILNISTDFSSGNSYKLEAMEVIRLINQSILKENPNGKQIKYLVRMIISHLLKKVEYLENENQSLQDEINRFHFIGS